MPGSFMRERNWTRMAATCFVWFCLPRAPCSCCISPSVPFCARVEFPDHDRRPRQPWRVPVHPRRLSRDVPQPLLDDAPVRGFGTAEESNQRYRYLLSQGTTGLSVAFDLPTQMGYDSDHPFAAGEVGRVGVAISSLADMERLFQDIPLEDVSTSMTINSTASILLAFYALVAQRRGADRRKLAGTIQNDILKEYIARGTYIYPPRPAMRIITDIFAWAGREMPEWNTISI